MMTRQELKSYVESQEDNKDLAEAYQALVTAEVSRAKLVDIVSWDKINTCY